MIGEKVTYRLAQRPGSYVVLEYTRPVYKLLDDQTIVTTPAPANVLDKSVVDVSFLAGMLIEEHGRLVSVQVLARDYPEERAMLAAASALLRERQLVVTFNGKSYDVPCFRERCDYHRIRTNVHRMAHVDVLHAARRRWKR